MATVRRAQPRDADDVMTLLAELGRPRIADDRGPQRNVFLDHLAYDDARVYVAEEDGRVVGLASLWLRPRLNWTTLEGWVPDLFVHPAYRQRGIGHALLDACVEEARRHRCHRLCLESGQHREAAHGLYESYGFEHVGPFYSLALA